MRECFSLASQALGYFAGQLARLANQNVKIVFFSKQHKHHSLPGLGRVKDAALF